MEISEKIKELTEQQGASLQWLAQKIGMTKAGFYRMIDGNSFKVDTLQKIADALEVPIVLFFGVDGGEEKRNEALQRENELLKELNATYKSIFHFYEQSNLKSGIVSNPMDYVILCLREPIFTKYSLFEKERIKEFLRLNLDVWRNNTINIFKKFGNGDEALLISELSKVLLEFANKKMTNEDWSKPVSNFF